jgi:hypothetical protein
MKILFTWTKNIAVTDEIIIAHLDENRTDPTHTQQNLAFMNENISSHGR